MTARALPIDLRERNALQKAHHPPCPSEPIAHMTTSHSKEDTHSSSQVSSFRPSPSAGEIYSRDKNFHTSFSGNEAEYFLKHYFIVFVCLFAWLYCRTSCIYSSCCFSDFLLWQKIINLWQCSCTVHMQTQNPFGHVEKSFEFQIAL